MPDKRMNSGTTIRENQVRAGLSERGWSLLLCLVCLVVVFSNLGGGALFEPDEGRNAEKAREILLLNDWVTPHENFLPTLDKPMGFYWLVAFSFKLFGVSEWSARLPSVLAALGCLFLVYRFARRHWGLWEALWSCLVLITSIEFFVFTRLVILDMSLTFFISWTLFSFYEATATDVPQSRRVHALLMYASMGAGTLVKGPIALVIPSIVICVYLFATRKWFLLKRLNIPLGASVYLAIVTPWYLAAEMRNPGYLRYFLWGEHAIRYLTPHFSRTKDWYYFFMVVGAGFLPWSLLLPFTVKNLWKWLFDDEYLFFVLWVLLPFVFFSASNAKLPHYILPIYPALALLTGRTVAAKLHDPAAKAWRLLNVIWIFLLGFLSYLVIGAASPSLLPSQIRSAVIEKDSLLATCGAVLVLIFAVFATGQVRNIWKDRGAAYLCTSIGLAIFLVAVGQVMTAASFRRDSKSLVKESATIIDHGDRLVFYDTYIEGIPFYLRIHKPIWLVQARQKEDVMGSKYLRQRRPSSPAEYGQVLFTFEEFAEQWRRSELALRVFVKEKNLTRLRNNVGDPLQIVARYNGYVLVANR